MRQFVDGRRRVAHLHRYRFIVEDLSVDRRDSKPMRSLRPFVDVVTTQIEALRRALSEGHHEIHRRNVACPGMAGRTFLFHDPGLEERRCHEFGLRYRRDAACNNAPVHSGSYCGNRMV